ncbi:sensor histidine kinase [Solirubrobacter sp. CPCC 204708]|uniref:Oxygen sensor histidine kinase NreB n=1 Tax=Solirubrobacter deserti TaxID=2282478 RepID=A0ABT4RLA3_9ACTN|nr:sensor histidine kinase [Solirubrobacter deserti]MBE2318940.1 sensor histidine kinase [Solirubrobacter deserti]MDA0139335.1 sensor histidine kinase [Solirubrobacter deserti]
MSERREELIWGGLLAGVLVVAAGAAWFDDHDPVTLALAFAFLAWHAAFVWLRRLGLVHVLGLIALMLVLVGRSNHYFLLVYAIYPQLFLRLGWWAVPGCGAVAAATFALADLQGRELIMGIAVTTGVALVLAVSIDAAERVSRKRAETIAELEAARAEVHEQGRLIGALEERQRIARELHDTLTQSLVSVVAQLEAAEQELEAGRVDSGMARLARGRDAARAGLTDARRAVHALRPDLLDAGDGLGAGLRVLAGRLRAEHGLDVAVKVRGDDAGLGAAVEEALLGCAREALSNVRRHADATHVEVALDIGAAEATLCVADDGRGFDAAAPHGSRAHDHGALATAARGVLAAAPRTGFGLTTMRERAATVGGRAEITSAPGAGTRVQVTVPL